MDNKNYIFSDKESIKYIHRTKASESDLDISEIGYGCAKNAGRYVLVRDCFILQFITEGGGKYCNQRFEAGDIIAVRPGQVEIREPDPNVLYKSVWLMAKGRTAAELLSFVYPESQSNIIRFPRTRECADIIKHTVDSLWKDRNRSVEFSLFGAFYSVLSLFPDSSKYKKTDPVSLAQTYINLNYKDANLKISDISCFSGVTQNHLCKLMKRETGRNTMENLLNVRLSKSAFLLENTNLPVSEIAFSVGFSDPKHFSQMFRAKYGLPPGAYRQK